MQWAQKILRIFLIGLFSYFAAGSAYEVYYAMSQGIRSGENREWHVLSVSLFVLYNLMAVWGLIRKKSLAIPMGYTVCFCILVMFMYEAYSHTMSHQNQLKIEDLLWAGLFMATPVLIFFGMRFIQLQWPQPNPQQQLMAVLAALLFLGLFVFPVF